MISYRASDQFRPRQFAILWPRRQRKLNLISYFVLSSYFVLHGLVDVNTNDFVVLSHNNNLRGNQYKLVKPIATSARDANFFSNRIINIWNSLPNSVVNADTVSCFYRRRNLNLTDIERFLN
jgi:hypothetical protein